MYRRRRRRRGWGYEEEEGWNTREGGGRRGFKVHDENGN